MRVLALAVFRRNDEVLLTHFLDHSTGESLLRPPGGGLNFGESSEAAIRREMLEELGLELASVRLLGVLESTFVYEGRPGHNVEFIYEATPTDRSLYEAEEVWAEEDIADAAGETRFLLTWRTLDDGSGRLVPQGLRELIEGG